MSTRKLPKAVLKANLLALAAQDAAHEADHRARFDKLIAQIKQALDAASDPIVIRRNGLDTAFGDVVRLAKHHLRMKAPEFEAEVSGLNTDISRVVNNCPAGKDLRELPEGWPREMLMKPEELRLSYSLMTPKGEAEYISNAGAVVGYDAASIARARTASRVFDLARRERMAAEAEEVAAASGAKFDAFLAANHLRQLEYEATNPPVPDYVTREREWLARARDPNECVKVVFEEDEFSQFDPEEMERIREGEEYYLRATAKNMIRELEKVTEQKFDRRWKTKAELHAALRAHFKSCGYDEELDLRWLRFGAYTDRSYR